jgi:tetratricopeptide (TPR) repeat protein
LAKDGNRRMLSFRFSSAKAIVRLRYDFDMIRPCIYAVMGLLCCLTIRGVGQASDAPSQAEALLREALRLLSENQPDAAIPEFRAIIALDPSNVDALGNLGVLLFFHGQYAEAIPPLRGALARKPDLWKIQALLGMAERRTGDRQTARTDLETSFPQLQDQKVQVETGLELVELYTGAEELEKATSVIATLRALDPENQQILYAAYRVHSDLAREAVLSLALVAPRSALMYQVMAHEAARLGATATAIRDDREALDLEPKLPGIHFELAELLSTLPRTPVDQAQTKAEYKLALEQNPLDEKAHLRLAVIAERDGDQKMALDLSRRAVALEPDDAEACYDLANLLVAMNQPENAVKLLEHAVQIDPTNATIHFRLGTVYRRLGRNAEAQHQIEQYRKYKDLKDKLRETFRELHLDPQKPAMDENGAGSQP